MSAHGSGFGGLVSHLLAQDRPVHAGTEFLAGHGLSPKARCALYGRAVFRREGASRAEPGGDITSIAVSKDRRERRLTAKHFCGAVKRLFLGREVFIHVR